MISRKLTTNHEAIKLWAESHSGQPAIIVDPNIESSQVGLRIDFPGYADEVLLTHARKSKTISWEDFFKIFEDRKLAFEYDEDFNDIDPIDSYDFVNRKPAKDTGLEDREVAEADAAIRDGQPKYYEHAGGVKTTTTEDIAGEESLGGDTPNLESDDDTTQAAADAGLLDPDDKKRLRNGN